ncbi:FtsH protease activity modulator HflK [Candidatus Thiodictyon syntrophicum]|jgi:membrane protease subunit HflK|uniref:Protein HflK n=1 Tax=Candidatus Thiodictyon syntrophicum TaxID=1166950 RepID=A0A2K8U9L2_9GAMM|nr:FtsH protease activity modulator HflK [Candidatus Thiodictyon syntrophicum]AUB82245.1 HflK protein [Candidatus Thiodictyon syntrophicum]
MAWNEPGGGNKDPWSGKSGGDQGPPDLDEVVRKLQEKLGGLFGGNKPGGNGGAGGGGGFNLPGGALAARTVAIIIGVLVLVWLATGLYIVAPAERGVVMRFGKYLDTTDPGPHWLIPYPFETVEKVNVDEVSTFSHQAAMLTKDENIVDVELTVQSLVQDPAQFLFQDQNPERSIKDATETVVRKTIGGSKLDFILTDGREAIETIIRERVQELMDLYKTGLKVTSVNMQPAKPPEQVKEAFDDAIKAREDKQRSENQAEAYSNQVLPQARGEAARIIADAKAYRDKVVAESEGEASRFTSVLAAYLKAPEVTRERLYLDTMQEVLSATNKVVLDVKEGASNLYLPLDQLMRHRQTTGVTAPPPPAVPAEAEPRPAVARPVDRDRRAR